MLAIEACRRKCLNCSQLFIFLNICSRMLLFKKFVKTIRETSSEKTYFIQVAIPF